MYYVDRRHFHFLNVSPLFLAHRVPTLLQLKRNVVSMNYLLRWEERSSLCLQLTIVPSGDCWIDCMIIFRSFERSELPVQEELVFEIFEAHDLEESSIHSYNIRRMPRRHSLLYLCE